MNDFVRFSRDQLPYLIEMITYAYEFGKYTERISWGKVIAADDEMWKKFFHRGESS